MNIEIWMCGFFGYKTLGKVDLIAKLKDISKDQKKFKISVGLILIEHCGIISLAVVLFIAFSPYNMILGIVWCISRIIEALIQIYDKKDYWGLLNIAIKYSNTSDAEKETLIDSGRRILNIKEYRFAIAQLFFSIGTFTYSLLFVVYNVIPLFIGWFGIVASILYGSGSGIFLRKSDHNILWSIGGLLILIFELTLGIWLLGYSVLVS